MRAGRLVLAGGAVLIALLVQNVVLARLPLPGQPPDLVLVLVVAVALLQGQIAGMTTGFAAGLLADLTADHPLGRLALAYLVAAYLAGRLGRGGSRSLLLPFGAVTLGALAALLVYAGEGFVLADARVSTGAFVRSLVSTVPYSAALTPFIVPVLGALLDRLDRGAPTR